MLPVRDQSRAAIARASRIPCAWLIGFFAGPALKIDHVLADLREYPSATRSRFPLARQKRRHFGVMSTTAPVVRLVVPAALALVAASGFGVAANAAAEPGPRLAFAYDTTRPLGFADRGVVARHGGVTVPRRRVPQPRPERARVPRRGSRRRAPAGRRGRPRLRAGIAVSSWATRSHSRSEVRSRWRSPSRRRCTRRPHRRPPSSCSPRRRRPPSATWSPSTATVLAWFGSVDPRRLGYLGWSAGAKTGAFVAASDRRFRALALLSAGADKLSAFVAAAPKGIRARARRALGSVDPLRYATWARPGTMLLEDGTRDSIVPHQALENMIAAAPHGTVVRWYPADHGLTERAHRDAVGWLLRTLG